jgi:hypothetical protein
MTGKIFINYRRGDDPGYPAVAMKSVEREVSLGNLNLRAGPGQDQKILARIPAGATGVAVTGSRAPPDRPVSNVCSHASA